MDVPRLPDGREVGHRWLMMSLSPFETRERDRERESEREIENGTWYEAVGHREDTRCLV